MYEYHFDYVWQYDFFLGTWQTHVVKDKRFWDAIVQNGATSMVGQCVIRSF
ncbi:hypothetical protein Hanom_Chr11g01048041 [Helianthus anomalus]